MRLDIPPHVLAAPVVGAMIAVGAWLRLHARWGGGQHCDLAGRGMLYLGAAVAAIGLALGLAPLIVSLLRLVA